MVQTNLETAIFGAGCFWGVEAAFQMQSGVIETTAGYTGGTVEDPTYATVCSGRTGHVEALLISYDPDRISYERLLEIFWQIHNPTVANRQGNDIGPQYQAAIFYLTEEQHQAAIHSKEQLTSSGRYTKPIITLIKPAGQFWPAEAEHQDYLEKHPGGYCHMKPPRPNGRGFFLFRTGVRPPEGGKTSSLELDARGFKF